MKEQSPRLSAAEVIRLLDLAPLEFEGGYFRRTYTHPHSLPAAALPPGYAGPRPLASTIYYLLTADTCSRLHRLPTDELWHFHLGDPVALHLFPAGDEGRFEHQKIVLGTDLAGGHQVQAVVPGGCWFGAHLVAEGEWALLGCTLAPAFADEDFTPAPPALVRTLAAQHPELTGTLAQLT